MIEVTDVVFTPARKAEVATGLLGYLRFTVGGAIAIDGVTARRTRNGRIAISFPKRGEHHIVRPTTKAVRDHMERSIISRLEQQAEQAAWSSAAIG